LSDVYLICPLDEGLEGNPEGLSAKELHQRAWEMVEPIFRANQREAMKRFERLHGKQSSMASDDLVTVVKAAKYGRVDTLFVPLGIQQWGRFDVDNNQVLLEEEPSLENEDLLDFVASQTILNSGQVYALQPEELPGKGDLAAILRYPT
jgi:peptide subunit release factor 1 (eRF1)